MRKINNAFQSILLAGLVGFAFAVVSAMAGSWFLLVVVSPLLSPSTPPEPWYEVAFEPDGTLVLQFSGTSEETTERQARTYADEEGKPLKVWNGRDILDGVYLDSHDLAGIYEVDWPRRILVFLDNQPPVTYWYFLHDGKKDGTGYFVGYRKDTNELVGFIGKSGFSSSRPDKEERFQVTPSAWYLTGRFATVQSGIHESRYPDPKDYQYRSMTGIERRVLVQADNAVFLVDLREESVKKVLESGDEKIEDLGVYLRPPDSNQEWGRQEHVFAIRTQKRILTFDGDGQPLKEWILPEELRDRITFPFYETIDGTAVATIRENVTLDGVKRPLVNVVRFDETGRVLSSRDVRLNPLRRGGINEESYLIATFIGPFPADFTLLALSPVVARFLTNGLTYGEAVAQTWREANRPLKGLIFIHLWAALLAWICYRRQKRYGASKGHVILWTVLVFGFGLPGLVGYLTHRRWPVFETCPNCGESAPVDREDCAVCGEELPVPGTNGTEVFA